MTTDFKVDNLIVSTINGDAPLSDPTSTKGDLIVNGGAGLVRLGVGANTYVLTASSTAPDGVAWLPAPGGGGGSMMIDARITFGATVDGSSTGGTDNLSDMTAGLATLINATPYYEAFIQNEGLDVNVSAKVPNPYGTRMGPGRLIQTGNFPAPYPGRVQLNSDADWRTQVFGQEYLYYFQNKLQARAGAVARFMGDSTTAGDALTHPYDTIDNLTQQVVADHGFGMTVVNAGHSGINTQQWVDTYLAGDIASNPDLMVIRYGINDPGWKKDGSAGTLNAYEAEYAVRRDIGDFVTSMRSALTTIRGAHDVTSLSIILMAPNSTSDSPNGRDEKWYELVGSALRQCARDFQCAFIDTYALWRDSRVAATRWMDNAFSDGRAIHPLDIMNQWIASAIGDLIVPSGMELRNVYASRTAPAITEIPSNYPIGYSTFQASWTIAGVAVSGMVITFASANGVVYQRVVDGAGSLPVAERVGSGSTWHDWISTPWQSTSLALQHGWTASAGYQGITYGKQGGIVTISGRIQGGTSATGTLVATLPAGFVPAGDIYRPVLCGPSLSTPAVLIVSAANPGQIIIGNCPDNSLLDVGISFAVNP